MQVNEIALVSAAFPPYTFGGIDIQTHNLAQGLSSSGVNVTVFCGLAKKPTVTQETTNLRVCRLPLVEAPPRVLWFQLKNVGFFRENLQKFDLVHTQHSSGSIYGLLNKRTRRPWIVSFHDHQLRRLLILFSLRPWNLSLGDILFYSGGYPLFDLLTRIELKYADHYIACGWSGMQDHIRFSNMDASKTTLIQNGIDISKIESIANSFRKNVVNSEKSEGITIFTCGRLYASKGTQFLLRAMPEVVKHYPDVHLKVFGKGPLRPRIEKMIRELGLAGHITLEGHVSYNELMYEMSRCDLAVFPSLIEVGASLAVMEAMGFHKPVIAFRYPFTMEIIDHLKTGYLVRPKSVTELAEAISLLLGDKKLRERLGSNAHLKILREHNWKDIVKKYIKTYQEVMATRK